MSSNNNNNYNIGRFLQFGLRPLEKPTSNQEYYNLLDQYLNQTDFRREAQAFAEGLGLQILYAGSFGLMIIPTGDSIFAMSWSKYRSSRKILTTDDRLITGFIHLGIMATVFPRPQDLEEDFTLARPAVTIEEVELLIRNLCEAMEQKKKNSPDLSIDEDFAGLYEAWTVYWMRPTIKETPKGGTPHNTTKKMIKRAFDFLQEQGCFKKVNQGSSIAFQPTWRYQLFVREFSADKLYQEVQELLKLQL
jgi:hypothetical protein